MTCPQRNEENFFLVPYWQNPNGIILQEAGRLLDRKGYRIKGLNLINFKKSMRYHFLAYICSEKDILKLLKFLILNTKEEGEKEDNRKYAKNQFLKAARKLEKLTPVILQELVEPIDVYHIQGAGKKQNQRIVIHCNFIGVLDVMVMDEYSENIVLDTCKGAAVKYITKSA